MKYGTIVKGNVFLKKEDDISETKVIHGRLYIEVELPALELTKAAFRAWENSNVNAPSLERGGPVLAGGSIKRGGKLEINRKEK